MNNTVGNILNFFSDTSKSIGSRVWTVIFVAFLLLAMDIFTGLTYNAQFNNRLSQLEKIQTLKQDFKEDPNKLRLLELHEEKILSRRHYSDWFLLLVSLGSAKITDTNIPNTIANPINSILDFRKMLLSSSYGFILTLPILLLMPFFMWKQFDKASFGGIALIFIMLIFTILITTGLAYLIPVISETRPYLNYLLNAVIHFLFLMIFAKFSKPSTPKTQPKFR